MTTQKENIEDRNVIKSIEIEKTELKIICENGITWKISDRNINKTKILPDGSSVENTKSFIFSDPLIDCAGEILEKIKLPVTKVVEKSNNFNCNTMKFTSFINEIKLEEFHCFTVVTSKRPFLVVLRKQETDLPFDLQIEKYISFPLGCVEIPKEIADTKELSDGSTITDITTTDSTVTIELLNKTKINIMDDSPLQTQSFLFTTPAMYGPHKFISVRIDKLNKYSIYDLVKNVYTHNQRDIDVDLQLPVSNQITQSPLYKITIVTDIGNIEIYATINSARGLYRNAIESKDVSITINRTPIQVDDSDKEFSTPEDFEDANAHVKELDATIVDIVSTENVLRIKLKDGSDVKITDNHPLQPQFFIPSTENSKIGIGKLKYIKVNKLDESIFYDCTSGTVTRTCLDEEVLLPEWSATPNVDKKCLYQIVVTAERRVLYIYACTYRNVTFSKEDIRRKVITIE